MQLFYYFIIIRPCLAVDMHFKILKHHWNFLKLSPGQCALARGAGVISTEYGALVNFFNRPSGTSRVKIKRVKMGRGDRHLKRLDVFCPSPTLITQPFHVLMIYQVCGRTVLKKKHLDLPPFEN